MIAELRTALAPVIGNEQALHRAMEAVTGLGKGRRLDDGKATRAASAAPGVAAVEVRAASAAPGVAKVRASRVPAGRTPRGVVYCRNPTPVTVLSQ